MEQTDKTGTAFIIIAVGAVAIVLIILFAGGKFLSKLFGLPGQIITKVGEGLGITATPEQQATVKEINDLLDEWARNPQKNPFAPSYWKEIKAQATGNKVVKLYTNSIARAYAAQVKSSVGTFVDSPEKAVGFVNATEYKSQISYVADIFQQMYGEDMLSYLVSHMDTAQQLAYLKNILNTANARPSGLVNA